MYQSRIRIYIQILLLSLFTTSSLLWPQSLRFNKLTVDDGLSSNSVNALIQDKTGFLWFGTDDGLDRYDGYKIKIFRNDPNDSNSISDNGIWSLYEDLNGNIWIGTKSGILNKYDPTLNKFTSWKINSEQTEQNSISTIIEDKEGNIWLGTYKDGLYKLDLTTQKISHWSNKKNDDYSLSHNYVQDLIQDKRGNLIVGTYNGLNIFDPQNPNKGFIRFYNDPNKKESLSNNLIWSLTKSEIDSNSIWVGTANHLTLINTTTLSFKRIEIPNPNNLPYGTSCNTIIEEINGQDSIIWLSSYSGLVKKDLSTGVSKRFLHSENDANTIISNQINKMICDRSGVLWLATENGISYLTPKSTLFNTIELASIKSNLFSELSKKNITAINKYNENKIWIGTSDGLYLLETINQNYQLENIKEFEKIHIWSIAPINENEIWVGTFGKGLKKFNYLTGNIQEWDLNSPKLKTQSLYYNKSLLTDKNKNLWIGYWGVGIARINMRSDDTKVWLNELGNPYSLSHNDVWVIKEDHLGRIWVGTVGGGLNLYQDKDGGIFYRLISADNDKKKLSGLNINCICEAKRTRGINSSQTILWIGTNEGLNKFEIKNRSSNKYDIEVKSHFYSIKDGLSNNTINSIVEDSNGNLWLGTGSGISFFDLNKKTFTNFSNADGINGSLMNLGSALEINRDLILIGSTNGLNFFDPSKIKLSSYKPRIVITDFQIFNKSVGIGNNSPLIKNIAYTDQIELSNNQDVFSFEFSALDYNSPKLIKYAYKMEGFDENWIESGNRRFITYTNLSPGDYIFKVKSTNADGLWNSEIASIRLIINPPWWGTKWAYGLYTILIIVGLLTIRRFELNRTKLRNELRIKEFEAKKNSELQELKSRFFANLSHEFRTPLMLIKGPIENLKNNESLKSNLDDIDLIERNSKNLEKLIDELLELSQLESSSIPLKASKENIVFLMRGILSQFESIALQKKIKLDFSSYSETKILWIDKDKLEKIMNNLLSNAIKFTPTGGEIKVEIQQLFSNEEEIVQIVTTDTGIGIPVEKLANIFDRFYQIDTSSKRSFGGSGIGLALVKEFIDLHKWEIEVESKPEIGTSFKIKIPTSDDYLNDEEKIVNDGMDLLPQQKALQKENYVKLNIHDNSISENISSVHLGKQIILIVDDSSDIRKYLTGLLAKEYTIIEATNGFDGIKSAIEQSPDIIISDVMMPSMDGIEFCQKIKSNWQTSDIPVILLTAKASFEDKLEGLEIGADAYLTKPFDSRELFVRIKNLLEQRKRIREKINKDQKTTPEYENLNKSDSEFIEKVYQLVKLNLDKTDYSTDQLAKELFLSRSQLHRKMIALAGQAPGEFVRIIKLQHAAKLLLEKKLSVTQIAYEIGFSSPAQFSRAFSKQYNCAPSEYSALHKASKK